MLNKKQHQSVMLLKAVLSGKNLTGIALSCLSIVAIASSVQAAPEKARSADEFVDSIGVNTHLQYDDSVYYKNYNDLIKPKLLGLGVRHIRDACSRNMNGFMDRVKELNTLGGIRTLMVCDPRDIKPQATVSLIKELGTNVVEAVQATNEFNLSGGGNWVNDLRDYQKQLWQAIKGDSVTNGVQVYGPSLVEAGAYNTLGDMSAYQDYGAMNNYMSGRNPGNSGWGDDSYGSLDWNVRATKKASVSKPIVTTESGYHNVITTANSHRGIPEDIAGKYTTRLVLEQFNYGIGRTYLYEFINVYNNPDSLYVNFGLLRNDGSEKPAYSALKNLINLLKEPGASFTPGSLDYALGGSTDNIHHTLLQKKDGRFYLILWKEAYGYNVDIRQYLSVPSQKVSVTLNTYISKATIYVPNDSADAKSSQTNPKQLDVEVGDRPIVFVLEK